MENTSIKDINVGDILYGTWGYGMTIPCFFKVLKVTDKRVKVIELGKRMVRSGDGGYNQMGWEKPTTEIERDARPILAYERVSHITIWEGGVKKDIPSTSLIVPMSSYTKVYVQRWDGREVWANYMD